MDCPAVALFTVQQGTECDGVRGDGAPARQDTQHTPLRRKQENQPSLESSYLVFVMQGHFSVLWKNKTLFLQISELDFLSNLIPHNFQGLGHWGSWFGPERCLSKGALLWKVLLQHILFKSLTSSLCLLQVIPPKLTGILICYCNAPLF